MNSILNARQKRAARTNKQQLMGNCMCIRANYPAEYKNNSNAILAINLAFNEIRKQIPLTNVKKYSSADGSYIIANFSIDEIKAKYIAIQVEEMPFGRCVDIDIYKCNLSSTDALDLQISRRQLNKPARKCVICDSLAAVCVRNECHSRREVADKYDEILRNYLHKEISEIINDSFFCELDLEDKFGLVTPSSCGSHKDMNYSLLCSAIKAIVPFLTDIFIRCLFEQLTVDEAKEIGISAFQQMNIVTSNVNAYKGAIYVIGSILYSAAVSIKCHGSLSGTFKYAAKLFGDIPASNTAGYRAYSAGIGGIRKEAASGYKSVRKAVKILNNDYSQNNLRKVLCQIVKYTDDSVLYKRSNGKYKYFKQLISSCTENNLIDVNNECIANNISIGGSADLLIASIMYDKLSR